MVQSVGSKALPGHVRLLGGLIPVGVALGALLAAALGACAKAPVEEAHTVAWYLEESHQAERQAKIKWCNDSADRAPQSPNCINAREAEQKWQLRPNAPSVEDNIKLK